MVNSETYASYKKPPNRQDQQALIGQRFNKLVVLRKTEERLGSFVLYECVCDCGQRTLATSTWLKHGRKKSCGCHRARILSRGRIKTASHQQSNTVTYKTWQGMHQRCYNKNDHHYPIYGGRGIAVHPRWHEFEAFLKDMGERPKGKSLDRIDVNGDYESSNCRWATPKEQANNRRVTVYVSYQGRAITVDEYSNLTGVGLSGARHRLRRGVIQRASAEEIQKRQAFMKQYRDLSESKNDI